MPIYSSKIEFSKLFAYSATIRFAPDSSFAATLSPLSGYFTDSQVVFVRLELILAPTSISIAGKFVAPRTGILYFTSKNLTPQIFAFHIFPRTITFVKTLANVTSNIKANRVPGYPLTFTPTLNSLIPNISLRFFYGQITFTPTLQNVTSVFDAKLVFFSGTLSSSLTTITLGFIGKFYYFSGTLSSKFINLAASIIAGTTKRLTVALVTSDVQTSIKLQIPIRVQVTIAIITGYVVKNVITGRVWPVGRLNSILTPATATIKAVLPIPIIGTLSTNTMAFQYPPFFRLFSVPFGRFHKVLDSANATIKGIVPIRIYVAFTPTLTACSTVIKLKALIAGTFNKTLTSISLGWFARAEIPRQGTINVILPIIPLIYAKTSIHGTLLPVLKDIEPFISSITPIRIDADFNPTTALLKGLIRGKSTIGVTLAPTTNKVSAIFRLVALIGGAIETLTPDCSMLITGRVPIRISGKIATGTASSSTLTCSVYITGRGHHRPILNSTLQSITVSFTARFLGVRGVIDLKEFTGPTFIMRPDYSGFVGELYPYRSGKFWKLQIYSNNGNQSVTTFSQIELLALDNTTGELVDLLDNDSSAKNFSSANTAYSQPDGMRWLHTFSKDTEIRAYKIKGLG